MKQLLQAADKREHWLYTRLRDWSDPYTLKRREFFQKLWTRYAPHAPKGFPKKLQIEFHQRWWEMYLAVGMFRLGFRPTSSKSDKGPDLDLSFAKRRIFVEATVPRTGQGTDKVPEHPENTVIDFPERECLLRLTQALTDKREKFQGYLDGGVVPAGSSMIIALSASDLNLFGGPLGAVYPAPLKVLAGAGHPVVTFGAGGRPPYSNRRDSITRDSGSPVDACLFKNQEFKIISAVLYSSADLWNAPPEPEQTFSLFLNPSAHKPLPKAFTRKFPCWAQVSSTACEKSWKMTTPGSRPIKSRSKTGGGA